MLNKEYSAELDQTAQLFHREAICQFRTKLMFSPHPLGHFGNPSVESLDINSHRPLPDDPSGPVPTQSGATVVGKVGG
jgi:hypothetical protein